MTKKNEAKKNNEVVNETKSLINPTADAITLPADALTTELNKTFGATMHEDLSASIHFNGVSYTLTPEMVVETLTHGAKQKAGDAVVRADDKLTGRVDILSRLTRGFWNDKDEKKANNTTSASAGKVSNITRAEYVEAFNEGTHGAETLKLIEKLSHATDEQFTEIIASNAFPFILDAKTLVMQIRKETAEAKQAESKANAEAILASL